jgi:predicted metal-binding protein
MNEAPPRLFVCGSCGLAPPERDGETRSPFAAAVAAVIADTGLELREVACLNGCLHPCNAALRAPARATLRFSALGPDDVAPLLAFAQDYWRAVPGTEAALALPAQLAARLATTTPPLGAARLPGRR